MFDGYAPLTTEEVGRSASIQSDNKSGSGLAVAISVSGAGALPWSWKERRIPCVYCMAPRVSPHASSEKPTDRHFEKDFGDDRDTFEYSAICIQRRFSHF